MANKPVNQTQSKKTPKARKFVHLVLPLGGTAASHHEVIMHSITWNILSCPIRKKER